MKKILLITSRYPYGNGEQFLETEIKYYQYYDISLTIMPKIKNNQKREIPNNIIVDDFLAKNILLTSKLPFLLKSFTTKLFYKELFSEKFINFKMIKIFLSSISEYQRFYDTFDDYFANFYDIEELIVYTYWNDTATYALQSLKEKYDFKLISRIHGGDLYKERQQFGYMPLKKHFLKSIDTIYTITQSANSYLEDTYGFNNKTLKVSRLGVEDKQIVTKESEEKCLNIVSCSFLTEVKQVDKIIKSLKMLANKKKNMYYSWVHIGDGALYDNLVLLAENELAVLDNIKYNFVGNYVNKEVYEFYANNEVDVFLNVSLSEGVPVSIMEAMSCRIPVVAPDIGGVSDMVINGYNGKLLSSHATIDEIVAALSDIGFFKDNVIRENSYKLFLEKYDANKNYIEFVENL